MRYSQNENEPIMISALEHHSYCPRQYALIHREQVFDENVFTVRGTNDHRRVDEGPLSETVDGIRVERSVPLWSDELNLVGRADVVEFHGSTPYPVEYKHGRRRPDRHSDLQLTAQAMCLEEMLDCEVPRGAIYHVSSRKRRDVEIGQALRERVLSTIEAIRRINSSAGMPVPVNDARCPPCSLIETCMPSVGSRPTRIGRLHRELFRIDVN